MEVLTVVIFLAILGVTLIITYWAARRTRKTSEFYAAGRQLRAAENGFALAGDWMSAAAFLGFTGLVALYGMDGSFYAVAALVAFLTILLLIAEPLRNTGKYTMADVIAYRMQRPQARLAALLSTIVVNMAYLIPRWPVRVCSPSSCWGFPTTSRSCSRGWPWFSTSPLVGCWRQPGCR
jgi:cation/acetate symporter